MSHKRELLVFFVLVFAWTWGLAALMILFPDWVTSTFGDMSSVNPLFVAAVYAPSLLGVILSAVFLGKDGLRQLFARLNPLRIAPWWYLVVPVGIFVIVWLSGLGASIMVGAPFPIVASGALLLASVTSELISDPGPIGEELGWRGFALPRMLEFMSPRWASLVLGAVWAVWHLPAFFISGTPQTRFSLPLFFLGVIAMSVLFTWLFIRTSGSLLIAILLHRMVNSDVTDVAFEHFTIGLTVVAVLLFLFGGMDKPVPPLARMGDREPGDEGERAAV